MANPFDEYFGNTATAPTSAATPAAGTNPFEAYFGGGPDIVAGGGGQPAQITVRPPGPPQPAPSAGQSRDFAEPITAGSAFARGLTTGATVNFYDELTGLARAGGLEPDDPNVANAIKALAIGGYKKLTGSDEEANRLYDEQVAASRKQTEQMQREQPGAFLAGNIAGALAVPALGATRAGTALAGAAAPLLGRAAPVVGRTVAGGLAGAGFGGLAGLGEAEGTLGERLPAAGTGAAIGAGVGTVAAPIVEGLIAGGGALAGQAARYVPGLGNIDVRALRAVEGTVPAAERADPNALRRLTQAELAATPAAAAIDVGGEGSRGLARWAANASPEARSVLSQFTEDRYGGRASRLTDWLDRTFNYPDAQAQSQAIQQTARITNAPAYQRSFAEGRAGIWDTELAALSQAPPIQAAVTAAIKQAQTKTAGELTTPGATAATLGARWTSPDGRPTLEFWDLVKRQLDQEINVAKRAGRSSDVADLTQIKQAMLDKLDAAVPSYQATRSGAAGFFGQDNALDLGKSWIARNVDPRQVAREWANLSPQEQKLAQDGFVSAFTQAINAAGGGGVTNMLNRINQSENANKVLNTVLGSQRANELEAMLRVESVMQRARVAVEGNSTTARQLIEAGAVGIGGSGLSFWNPDPYTIGSSILAAGFAARGRRIDRRVAERVAEMLTSRDPQVFARGLQTAARNDRVMNALRSLGDVSGQAGALAAGRAAAAPPAAPQ